MSNTNSFQNDAVHMERLPRIRKTRIPLMSAVFGAMALVISLLIGFFASSASHQAQINNLARQNQLVAKHIAAQLSPTNNSPNELAVTATETWQRMSADGSNGCLSVVGPQGKVLANTSQPAAIGKDVSGLVIPSDPPTTLGQIRSEGKSWSGQLRVASGEPELVSYEYSPAFDGLIGVHVPVSDYQSQLQSVTSPWMIGFGISALGLWPCLWLAMSLWVGRQMNHAFSITDILRKRARSNSRLANVVSSFPDAIVSCTPDSNIDSWNEGAKQLLGYTRDQAIGTSVFSFIPGDRYSEFEDLRKVLLEGKSVREMETKCLAKGNRQVEIGLTVAPILNSRRMIVGAVGVLRNLAERREAEKQSRLLQLALDSTSNGVMIVDVTLDTKPVIYVNPAYERITGYSSDEVVGRRSSLFERHAGSTTTLDALRHAVQESQEAQAVILDEHKDGSSFWNELHLSPIRNADQHVTHYVVIHQNVSDRKLAEDRLRSSEQHLRQTMDMLPDMIWIADTTKNCNYFNKTWLEFTGRNIEQERGTGWSQNVHPDDLERCLRTFQEAFDRRDQFRMEFRLRRHDGIYRTIMDVGVPWFEQDGRFIGYLGSCLDITDRKDAVAALRQREVELAHVARLSTLGEMVAGIAHEINQPLFAISNYAQTCLHSIRSKRATNEQLIQWTEHIYEQATRAGAIIHRMRDFLKKGSTSREIVEINQLVAETLELMEFEFRRGQIHVTTELAKTPLNVEANRVEIQQVTVNLIRNAVEALLPTDVHQERRITIRTQSHDRHVMVSVVDNGPGIDRQVSDKLTDPFVSTKPDGMGMGLAISRTIINSHHGHLRFENVDGQGACFSFTVPSIS